MAIIGTMADNCSGDSVEFQLLDRLGIGDYSMVDRSSSEMGVSTSVSESELVG